MDPTLVASPTALVALWQQQVASCLGDAAGERKRWFTPDVVATLSGRRFKRARARARTSDSAFGGWSRVSMLPPARQAVQRATTPADMM